MHTRTRLIHQMALHGGRCSIFLPKGRTNEVRIAAIESGSAAADAGLAVGDRIRGDRRAPDRRRSFEI